MSVITRSLRNLPEQPFIIEAALGGSGMKIRITMNGKQITAKEAVSDLLHPDRLAEKMLQERIAGVTCDEHPIQCRHLTLKVTNGKVVLQNVCCEAFRQKVLAALQTQSSPSSPPQQA